MQAEIQMTTEDRLRVTRELEMLLADYWHEVDTNWGRRASEFFTEDGVFEGSEHAYRGREKIDAFYRYRLGRGPRVAMHVVSNFRALVHAALRQRRGTRPTLGAADPDRLRDRPVRAGRRRPLALQEQEV